MVYHTFLGKFQPTFSISGPGDGFKKRYAFLINVFALKRRHEKAIDLCGSTKSKDSLTRSGAVFSRKPH